MVKLTIIIPVYNAKPYLERCFSELFSQNLEDSEIIVVDDGSTDGSGAICDSFCQGRANCFVIHKTNQGAASARNEGLRKSQGFFVTFLDSDDYLAKDGISHLKKCIDLKPDVDVFLLPYSKIAPSGGVIYCENASKMPDSIQQNHEAALDYLVHQKRMVVGAWSLLLKRSFLFENSLFFVDGLLSEDVEWCPRVLAKAKVFSSFPWHDYYFYCIHDNSCSHSGSVANIQAVQKTFFRLGNNCSNSETFGPDQNFVNGYLCNFFIFSNGSSVFLPKITLPGINRNFYQLRWILKYGRNSRCRFFRFLTCILGFRLSSWLLRFYTKLKK